MFEPKEYMCKRCNGKGSYDMYTIHDDIQREACWVCNGWGVNRSFFNFKLNPNTSSLARRLVSTVFSQMINSKEKYCA